MLLINNIEFIFILSLWEFHSLHSKYNQNKSYYIKLMGIPCHTFNLESYIGDHHLNLVLRFSTVHPWQQYTKDLIKYPQLLIWL